MEEEHHTEGAFGTVIREELSNLKQGGDSDDEVEMHRR